MVRLRLLRSFVGPNPFATDPGLLASLTIEDADLRAARDRVGQIHDAYRTWFRHEGRGADGRALSLDTRLGIADFLAALSLAVLNEFRGFLQTASAFEENGEVLVYVGFHQEQVTADALRAAVDLFNRIDGMQPADIGQHFSAVWRMSASYHPDYQARMLMQAARGRDIPYLPQIPFGKYWRYGWGRNGRMFFESSPGADSLAGGWIAAKKGLSKSAFMMLGAPVVPHLLVASEQDIANAARSIPWPCVVKPTDRGRSLGVTVNVTDMAGLIKAFHAAREHSKAPVMIEQYVPGDVHRILVIRGKVTHVIRRDAPYVIGDGARTLADLVNDKNLAIAAAQRPDKFLGQIPVDADFHAELKRQGVRPDDVIETGRRIRLRKVPLLSTGAVYSNVTAQVHPHIIQMAQSLADAFGFAACGIDFVTDDISRSYTERGAIIEINNTPGLRVLTMAGIPPEEIGGLILGDEPGRIPVTLILCDRALQARLREALTIGPDCGWVMGGESGVGSMPLVPGDRLTANPALLAHAQTTQILLNPHTARAVIACDPEDVMAFGLPVDRCDGIICCGYQPDERWRRVFEQHAARYVELDGVGGVESVLSA